MTNSLPHTHENPSSRRRGDGCAGSGRARSQRGAATLLIGLTLVMASVGLAMSVAHTAVLEQRMARNGLLATQATEAAQAGLGFASAWLIAHRPGWIAQPDGSEIAAPDRNPPALATAGGGAFAVNLALERRAEWQGFVRVEATASPAGAPEIAAQVSRFMRPTGVLTHAGETAPPLLVDGCADVSAGRIYPQAAATPQAGTAIVSSADVACITGTVGSLNGGAREGAAFAPGALWSHVFAVSRDEFRELAAGQAALDLPPAERDYWWASAADLVAGDWRLDLGSPERPVVLVVPAELGCPRFTGGVRVVGLVYIEAECLGAPAWDDMQIYGSLAVAGSVAFDNLGPGSRLLHISHAPGTADTIAPPRLDVLTWAGSWKDF